MSESTPIVVVTYNRASSLRRILKSLDQAEYDNYQNIPLIISIDYHSENEKAKEEAENFNWNFGKKTIINHKTNLGLRKHIIQCGDYSIKYGNVIILEDDLFVSPAFYLYAIEALEFSKNKDYIGGISLYNHQLNEQTFRNFSPIEDGYDNWYLQFAASWGQCWTKKQWLQFKIWYQNQSTLKEKPTIPRNVTNWSEKSWLKYHIAFLIETNLYFLYPKVSLSTNFSEIGTHNNESNTSFQAPLKLKFSNKPNFSTLDQSCSVYDAFFENTQLSKHLNLNNDECSIDLYGFKPLPTNKQYLLTTKKINFQIINSFGLSLKPHDSNVIFNINGDDIYLYDLLSPQKNQFKKNRYHKLTYNYKILLRNDSFYLAFKIFIKSCKNFFYKLI